MRKGIRVGLALLAVLTSACGAAGTPVDPAPVSGVAAPLPVGVTENPPVTTPSAAPSDCNPSPRQSYRPGTLPSPGQMPGASTMQAIQQRGFLRAGVDQTNFRFGYRDSKSNQLVGFDIDRAHEIAAAIFGDPNKIQFTVMGSADRIPALQNNSVDVVVRTFTATCDRWNQINFSQIYYVAHQKLLVENSSNVDKLADLAGKRVCAQNGSTSILTLAQKLPNATRVAPASWSDCLVMLQQHQVDAVSTDDVILNGMKAQDPNNLKVVGENLTDEPYGIGIPKEKTDMVRFVNAVLDKSVQSGAWAASYGKWLNGTASAPPAEYRD
jgi:polar amino acid transport system substrate-binding protein